MVLLEEEPHRLLASVQENFGIDGDTAQIARISDDLKSLQSSRQKTKDDQQRLLRNLTRALNAAKQTHDEAAKTHQSARHVEKLYELDREKFNLGKKILDLEKQTHLLEGQLAQLRQELDNLDADDPTDRAVQEEDDGTTLKLHVYRGLGIELEEDGAGGYSKAIVRNVAKGDFNIVNLEEKKWTRHFYVNYFWDLL
ncbi:Spc24 subunit of Ndc80-domain-containing protein [Sphaerosporella brunnea]|uniref:Kinetochore protein Spc24 n=1 Tax=Sphaerosporella brunnea TaxID=1250544 RepID=A0A5J5EK78_9PEZI|nr:Spc24 subunit of Ndc80-domain-containing protein [Sphaerosporella brunnea]